jgi:hypothetical protein
MNNIHSVFLKRVFLPLEKWQSWQKLFNPHRCVYQYRDAHSEGLINDKQKATEKSLLFADTVSIVFGREALQHSLSPDREDKSLFSHAKDFFSWSREGRCNSKDHSEEKESNQSVITAEYKNETITLPFLLQIVFQ